VRIISSEVPPASPLLRDCNSDHIFERICAAEMPQRPVVLTFSIARDGLDLGFETVGCVAGRARAFSVRVSDYLNPCFVKNHEEKSQKHCHECT